MATSQAERRRPAAVAGRPVVEEGADHGEGALGEVDDARAAVDEDEALRRQGVDRADAETEQDEPEELAQGVSPTRSRSRRGTPRRPTGRSRRPQISCTWNVTRKIRGRSELVVGHAERERRGEAEVDLAAVEGGDERRRRRWCRARPRTSAKRWTEAQALTARSVRGASGAVGVHLVVELLRCPRSSPVGGVEAADQEQRPRRRRRASPGPRALSPVPGMPIRPGVAGAAEPGDDPDVDVAGPEHGDGVGVGAHELGELRRVVGRRIEGDVDLLDEVVLARQRRA